MSTKDQQLPNLNNLSVLVAMILLAYTLTHFVSLPAIEIELRFLGIYLPFRLNFTLIVSLLVAGLVASGTAWLLREHPDIQYEQYTIEHWLLPGLTSLVLMLVIEQIPFGMLWWVAAAFSGLLLTLVLMAEYIAVDPDNEYYSFAEIGITTLSMSFFLILAIALHAEEIRLFFRVPLLSLTSGLVFLRILHLRLKGRWVFLPALLTVLCIGQLSAGLHYWPMSSISFGIALLGPLYALIEIGERHSREESTTLPQMLLFPGFVVLLSWLVAFLL